MIDQDNNKYINGATEAWRRGRTRHKRWRKAAQEEEMAWVKARKSIYAQGVKDKNKLYNSGKAYIWLFYSSLNFHMKTLLLIVLWSRFLIKQEFFLLPM